MEVGRGVYVGREDALDQPDHSSETSLLMGTTASHWPKIGLRKHSFLFPQSKMASATSLDHLRACYSRRSVHQRNSADLSAAGDPESRRRCSTANTRTMFDVIQARQGPITVLSKHTCVEKYAFAPSSGSVYAV